MHRLASKKKGLIGQQLLPPQSVHESVRPRAVGSTHWFCRLHCILRLFTWASLCGTLGTTLCVAPSLERTQNSPMQDPNLALTLSARCSPHALAQLPEWQLWSLKTCNAPAQTAGSLYNPACALNMYSPPRRRGKLLYILPRLCEGPHRRCTGGFTKQNTGGREIVNCV
jgi:hypothetical protein